MLLALKGPYSLSFLVNSWYGKRKQKSPQEGFKTFHEIMKASVLTKPEAVTSPPKKRVKRKKG